MNAPAVPYRRLMVARARTLRRNSTDAEKRLWSALRNRRLEGIRFRRQVILGRYVADFCSANPKLVVELDGLQHEEQQSYDEIRTRDLQREGYLVLRFWNGDVLAHLDGVLEVIEESIRKLNGFGEGQV
jgi:very-short-patch-repair endonuclease